MPPSQPLAKRDPETMDAWTMPAKLDQQVLPLVRMPEARRTDEEEEEGKEGRKLVRCEENWKVIHYGRSLVRERYL